MAISSYLEGAAKEASIESSIYSSLHIYIEYILYIPQFFSSLIVSAVIQLCIRTANMYTPDTKFS